MTVLADRVRPGLALAAAIIGLAWSGAAAQEGVGSATAAGGAAAAQPAVAAPSADLVLANRTIFTFRAPHLGVSPEGRADSAAARIRASLRRGEVGEVGSVATPEGTLVTVGGEGVFRITPGDLNAEVDESLDELRERTLTSLTVALREEMELRSLPNLLRALGRTAAATLVFLLALWAVRRGSSWAGSRLVAPVGRRIGTLSVGGYTLVGQEQLTLLVRRLVGMLRWLAILSVTYVWLFYALQQFPYTRPWGEELGGYLWALAGTVLRATLDAVPGLVLVALIVVTTRYVTHLVGAFFTAVERGDVTVATFHPDTAQATRRILVVVLWLFATALAYPYLPGSSSAAFQGISVLVGVMLSLGSTNLVGQLMSGFVIVYGRNFRPGDYVRIGETEGTVQSMGLFVTKIRTNKLEEVSLPNSLVVAAETKNYSRPAGDAGVILYTSVTIGYDTPWRQVHALPTLAAERTAGLKKDPPPFVYQTALSDFYVEYQLNAHLERPEQRVRTLAALHANIQDAFNEHGVQIMSPHYEADPAAPKVVPRERWHPPSAR